MQNKKRKEITDCLIDNDDYFFRDNEMFRASLDNTNHQVDPTYDIPKEVREARSKRKDGE